MPLARSCCDCREGDEHAERAVVFSRVADGVEMRAEQERFRLRVACEGQRPMQIEGGVFADLQARPRASIADECIRPLHGGRMKGAREAPGLVADRAELVAALHHAAS